jgi:hypothetical protein
MKDVGHVVSFLGALVFAGGVIWLREFSFTWKDTRTSVVLIVVGIGMAVAGERLLTWAGQSRKADSDPRSRP